MATPRKSTTAKKAATPRRKPPVAQHIENYGDTVGIVLKGGDGAAVVDVANSIKELLSLAYDTHQDQDTVRLALNVMTETARASQVNGAKIESCDIRMNTPET